MEKEKKYFKGMVIGLLCVVVMLFGIVINIGKTYSLDTTPSCLSENGVIYSWKTNKLEHGACCPITGYMDYDSEAEYCTADSNADGSCPGVYSRLSSTNGLCYATPGRQASNVCYSCDGIYKWGAEVASYKCPSSWNIVEGITNESDCKSKAETYEVEFVTDGGTFYIDKELAASNIQSLSSIDWSRYTAVKENYVFKGWTTTKNNCTNPYTSGSSNVLEAKTVYACYEKKESNITYQVTLKAGTGGTIKDTSNNNVKNLGETYTITNLSNGHILALSNYIAEMSGKKFKGWSKSSNCNDIIGGYTINSNNATLHACYSDSDSDTTTYTVTFNPNGGTFSDSTTANKIVKYTGKLSLSNIKVSKTGYNFGGWYSTNSKKTLTQYIDSAENNDVLFAIWQKESSGDSGSGDEENTCEFASKDACEIINDGYTCVEDNNGCYVKGLKKDDDSNSCLYESKSACEIINEGYNCKLDSNGCYVKSSKKDDNTKDDGSTNDNTTKEPTSNPNTGNSLLYLAIIMAAGTIGYTLYYVFKLKKEN